MHSLCNVQHEIHLSSRNRAFLTALPANLSIDMRVWTILFFNNLLAQQCCYSQRITVFQAENSIITK
jgi:hypothetical protein